MSDPRDERLAPSALEHPQPHDEDVAGDILADLTSNRYEPEAPCRADVQPDGLSEYAWAPRLMATARCAMWL